VSVLVVLSAGARVVLSTVPVVVVPASGVTVPAVPGWVPRVVVPAGLVVVWALGAVPAEPVVVPVVVWVFWP
jgi:hypothetical protein